jgi:hypothetical protein
MPPFIFIEARIFDIGNLIWQINKIPSYFLWPVTAFSHITIIAMNKNTTLD